LMVVCAYPIFLACAKSRKGKRESPIHVPSMEALGNVCSQKEFMVRMSR
jgi:hypothetical protein